MKFNRQSIRLKNFDYRVGMYFVTVDSWRKIKYFGQIINQKMELNCNGLILREEILNTPKIRKGVFVDIFQIMPDHFHMILEINVGAHSNAPVQILGNVIRGIKMVVAKRIKIEGKINNPIWHRNYYERVIRNQVELYRIKEYIVNNPKNYKEKFVV